MFALACYVLQEVAASFHATMGPLEYLAHNEQLGFETCDYDGFEIELPLEAPRDKGPKARKLGGNPSYARVYANLGLM